MLEDGAADRGDEGAPPAPRRKRPSSPRQIEKNSETRRRIVEAAGKVVGRHGYAGASIARITAEAGVAHGAFYLHFANRQALVDVLLPEIGAGMLRAISAAVRDCPSLEEIERRGLTANFEYLARHPELDRVMNEAELYAPDSFDRYVGMIQERYRRSLMRSRDRGDLRPFSDAEIATVAALLTGARSYLLRLYAREGASGMKPLGREQIEIYLDVFLNGIAARRA
ncbi:HTH-type transcriptional regulator BetI [Methylobacterium crusticola]|uniref:HTH-type transcriptional regulator BetI n=1 Tax=Methylobacterium crusticola TaxID=1697972 RepID=A0ABQ4R458_9HYPH|nr:TetR/AcrR family transcriptional regulator [Methylobacterium crusticola]GJD52217.1 HTH-type transcriptional regulator BetI [Methylobacterium crusticola]